MASQRKQKQTQSETHLIRDLNHEFLLNIPNLLPRLVNLVKTKDYMVRYDHMEHENDHFLQMIENSLSDTDDFDDQLLDGFFSDNSNSIDSISVSLNATANNNNRRINNDDIRIQPAILAASKINDFVLVLYTLSLFLIGKERKNVQKELTNLKLASALNSLFDFLYWNCNW